MMARTQLVLPVFLTAFLLVPLCTMAAEKTKKSETKKQTGPSISLKVTAQTWRKSKEFDLAGYLSQKLVRGGYRVVKGECPECPFTLDAAYSEVAGRPFEREGDKGTYTTDIELSLSLTRGGEVLWWKSFSEVSVEPNFISLFCPPFCGEKDFHREAVRMLKGEIEIEYIDQFVGIKTGTSQRTENEIIASGLKDGNPDVVESSGRAARENGPQPALLEPLFSAFLRTDLPHTDSWVAKAIGRYPDDQITDRIISILGSNKNENVLKRAAWYLGCGKIEKAAPQLLENVKTGPVLSCLEATDALMRVDSERFLQDLKAAEKKSRCGYYIRQTLEGTVPYNPLTPCR